MLVGVVYLAMAATDYLALRYSLRQQMAHNGRSHHAAVAGDVNLLLTLATAIGVLKANDVVFA